MNEPDRALIERYFAAMRAGPAGEEALLDLFTDDAVYVEPFTGERRTHVGIEAIRACLRASWQEAPPDMQLTVERMDLDGTQIRAEWICTSPALPGPMRGVDRYTLRDGRIARLEVSPPQLLQPDA